MITGGDLQSQITGNKFLNKFTTTPYGEFHLKSFNIFNKTNPVHSFTGPGTKLDIRLENYDEIMDHYNESGKLDITPIPKDFSKPINRIDEAAMIHDVKYISTNLQDRHKADVDLIHANNNITSPTAREKLERGLVNMIMKMKITTGTGQPRKAKLEAIKKLYDNPDIADPIQETQEVHDDDSLAKELHHQYRKPKNFLKVQVPYKDHTHASDLAVMPKKSKEGYKYILVVIDLYTRYGWAIPMIDKRQETLAESFEIYFHKDNRIPEYLWFDREAGITSKYFKKFASDNNIHIYHTYNEGKSVFAERFILTLKNMMWKHFTAIGNQQWDNSLLQAIVSKYNNNIHSSINTTPLQASTDDVVVETSSEPPHRKARGKFRVGDRVRIFKYKTLFEKGYSAKWTNEIFLIKHVRNTNPITYRLIDLKGEDILGMFYDNELQNTVF